MSRHQLHIALRDHRWRTILQLATVLPSLAALGGAVFAAAYFTTLEAADTSAAWAALATLFAVVSLGG
ncbi:MAG: hypothetical protein M3R06_00570, partial [Chloroflexota bacterium]|nr:hypothetical protein [Chloroflexota bacterium]